jgi:glycosyltransferase involved in cell wall biosynthesis
MTPTVSVVIPAFNHVRFVAEAITSVLRQSFADVEIVVIDDGSTDGTPDVVREFSDPRVQFEAFPENRGAVIALNSAIRRSRGEYICFLASDDYFLPGKLENQVTFLTENRNVAAIFGMPTFIDESGNPLRADEQFNGGVFESPFRERLTNRDDWLKHFFFSGNCLCHPTAMVRRSAYDTVGLYDPRLANLPDFDMWVRISMSFDIAVASDAVTAMRIHDNNRNMSAPRRDTLVRAHFETYEILKRYRRLELESLRRIFASEIAQRSLTGLDKPESLLAQLALTSPSPIHALFGLDTMFESTALSDSKACKSLIEISGIRDIFGIDIASRLNDAEAKNILEKDEREKNIAALNERLEREQALEAATRSQKLELEEIIKLSAIEIEGIQRSKTYWVIKLQKSFRRRIERLKAALHAASRNHH